LAGLQVARAVRDSGKRLSELAHVFEPVPQVLINVKVAAKEKLEGAAGLWEEVAKVEAEMGEDGRVLLRPSGTEPVVRVMVEAVEEASARRNAQRLVDAVERHLG
jgi:phosphoglucosamine mutase